MTYRAMGLAPGEQILLPDEPVQQSGKSYPCPNVPGMCLAPESAELVRKRAREECPNTTPAVRGWGVGAAAIQCNQYPVIGGANWNWFNPCWVKSLPSCPSTPGVEILTTPEEPEEDENSAYIVGGILALLALGGVGYAVLKKRKKKGKR